MFANSGKLLVPLATMVVAGAVTIGSGADWSASEPTTTSIASGALTMDASGATLAIGNMKPGDVRTGSLTVTNTGTLDANIAIRETGVANNFVTQAGVLPLDPSDDVSDLQIVIKRDGTSVYSGNFGGLAAEGLKDVTASDPILAADATSTNDQTEFTFEVTLVPGADAASQSKAGAATYTFTTTPTASSSSIVPWS